MSVFRWKYDETCEGRYCCGDCDKCDKEDEPVDDLISRRAAIEWCLEGLNNMPSAQPEVIKINIDHELTKDDYEKLRKDMADAPIVLLPERKTGRWILHENQRQEDVDNGNYLYICSECGKSDIHAKTQEVPFCWWCGSKMEVEHDG